MKIEVKIIENGKSSSSPRLPATVTYVDHQPGDATRYEVLAVDLQGKGIHLGNLGYVGEDAVVIVCGQEGRSSSALFKKGQYLNEWDVAERLGIKNEHTIHHVTEVIAVLIGSESKVACQHKQRED